MITKAKKSLGQNFLINPHIIDRIIAASEIEKDDIILEVGPGTGNLTKKLAKKAKQVIAVEKDRRLIGPLKEIFSAKDGPAFGEKNYPNVEIIEEDILDTKVPFVIQRAPLYSHNYKIVANIPYYITSKFLRILFEKWPTPKLIVLTIQKEVAQRIMAKSPHMNLLALSIQYYSAPEIIGYVSKNNFRPIPKVDSAIIRLRPRDPLRQSYSEVSKKQETRQGTENLFKLIRAGFSEKRKQLASVLAKKFKIPKEKIVSTLQSIDIDVRARAENLTLEQWILALKELKKYGQ